MDNLSTNTVKKSLKYFKNVIDILSNRLFFLNTGGHHRKLKILVILPYAPYPVYTGGASRIFQKIKYFGTRHHLVVASFYGPTKVKDELGKMLKPYCKKVVLVKRDKPLVEFHAELPIKVQNVTTRKMWATLEKLGNNFDIVMFEHIYTAMYRELFKSCYTIMEEHNIESRILKQYADYNQDTGQDMPDNEDEQKQADLLQDFETQYWPLFKLRTTVSEMDRNYMQLRCDHEILVINNGIHTNEITPVEYQEGGKILYMGNMSYRPNIEAVTFFINVIFPILIRKDPALSCCIAGTNIPPHILELAKSCNIECIENPPDMSKVAAKCSVSVVPLNMGSGTRIKILHSMAMGIPVVSTSLGCEGLSVCDEEHLLVRDDPESFAEAIIRVRSDKALRNKLRMNGRRLVKHEYNWPKILGNYENELKNRIFNESKTVKA